MAFNNMIRRVTSFAAPLVIRTTASQLRVAAVGHWRNTNLCREVRHRGSTLLPRFSTVAVEKDWADKKLVQSLTDEIESAEEEPKDIEEFPKDFPFELQDNPGERTIVLKRKYQDENIEVQVDMPTVDASEDNEDDENVSSAASSIPLIITITKGDQCLEFGVTAFPDEVTIDSLSVRGPDSEELAYEGPDFGDLDENLQKAFHKYLTIRGIKASTTNFLFDYMQKKDNREYFQWLHNLKDFMEK